MNPATAKQQFDELGGELEEDPIEQLRFFCSLALNSQDWLDVEPFFDAITSAPTIPAGYVLVPVDLLIRASESLAAFVSDESWKQVDMDVMDNLDAFIITTKQGETA